MKESDFSAVLVRSVRERGGFANKMRDPSLAELRRGAPKRPYDLYYVLGGSTVHVEAKFLKGYRALNPNVIADHQYENLRLISENSSPRDAIVAVGVWEPRAYYDAFFFTIDLMAILFEKRRTIDKKTMLRLRDRGLCLKVENVGEPRHDEISIETISEVLVWEENQLMAD